jgi:hypothetical protein
MRVEDRESRKVAGLYEYSGSIVQQNGDVAEEIGRGAKRTERLARNPGDEVPLLEA